MSGVARLHYVPAYEDGCSGMVGLCDAALREHVAVETASSFDGSIYARWCDTAHK